MKMLPTIRFRPKAFEYRVCLGNTQGDITEEGNAIQEKVADESRVAVRELPILCVPASINDYLDVIISHAKAFDRVYVQLLNQVSALTEVNDRLQRFYESGSSSLKQLINPYRGQLCAVKDNQSGRYYRAAVVCRPDPINIQVYCIDYGMTLNVGKEEVLQLAAGFNNLPPQAIAVQLSDVIEDRVRMSLDQFTACFETKLVTIRLDGRKEDKYLVSMAIINGKRAPVNVSDIVMGMASMPGDQSAAATEPLYVSPSKSSMASTDNGAGLREQEVVPQMAQLQVNVQHKDPPQPSGYPTPPLSERASSIAIVTKIEPAVVSVPAQDVCVRVDGPMARPWCFYVQLERFAEQLRQMEAEIREPSTPLDEATVGAACIANFLGGWYRAEIITVNGQALTLRYIDYGNVELKQLNEVFAITEEQTEVVRLTHKLAIPCKLVDGSSNSAVERFQSAFPENCGIPIVLKEFCEDDQMYLIDLKNNEQSVTEAPVAQNAAENSLHTAYMTKIESPVIPTPLLETAMRSDDEEPGSPSHFYLQLDRFADKIQQMLEEIKEPTILVDQPKVGMACMANFLGDWYRAEIIGISDDSLVLRYVDYGNVEEKKPNEVFAITDEQPDVVRHTLKLAILCKLTNDEGKEWSTESFQAAFPSAQTVQVNIKGKDGEFFVVDTVGSTRSVKEEAVDVGTSELHASNVTKIDGAVVSVPVTEFCVRSDDTSSTPSRFYVQLERFFGKVQQMLEEIKEPTVLLHQPKVGMACIANFLGDWYRAEIIGINDDSLVVRYVDYGNVEEKKPSEVFAITDEQPEVIRHTHKLAIPCSLIDQKEQWTAESFQAAFPAENSLQVAIKSCEGDMFLVDLMTA